MLECGVMEAHGLKWLQLKGRVDSITGPELEKRFEELVSEGGRKVVVNFSGITFISSAGLRVLLSAQKAMRRLGGEYILFEVPDAVLEVIRLSGFHKIFSIANSLEEITKKEKGEEKAAGIIETEYAGMSMRYISRDADPGSFMIFGSVHNLPYSNFNGEDVVTVKATDVQYGTGFTTVTRREETFDNYKGLFGESMIIDGNVFYYPAIARPAVDYMLGLNKESVFEYKFLHGFGFSGDFKYIISFECPEKTVELPDFTNALLKISGANKIGIVFLAVSGGFFGMHMKKTPLAENKPNNGKKIFDSENFYEWLHYDVKPDCINNVIAGTGIIIKDRDAEDERTKTLISQKKNCHLHAGVFEKKPLDTGIDKFDDELNQVLSRQEISRVQHVLDKSSFSRGIVGIVDLDVFRL